MTSDPTDPQDTSDFEAVPNPRRRKSDHVLPKPDLSDPAIHTAKILRRHLLVLTILTVALYVIIAFLTVGTIIQGNKNTRALCAIRDNAAGRVAQAERFLDDNPKGIPGISVGDIRRSITQSRQTVRSLSDVNCPPIP
jgi:hypothetical protein